MYSDVFVGKTALVTGAGQGIGFEIARQLCRAGASVLINDQDPALAAMAAKTIRKENAACAAFPGDCSEPEFISRMIEYAVSEFGSVDIAVANAGITLFGDFLAFTQESFSRVVKVNMQGTFFLAQSAAKQMIKQKRAGAILFTSSITGRLAHKGLSAYGMTKAGIEMLVKSLVIELSAYGITINSVVPGATKTERTVADKNYEIQWAGVIPSGRVAEPIDIANAALFLLSPASRHISGQNLVVDGGISSISISPF